jgi:hypothetical protein
MAAEKEAKKSDGEATEPVNPNQVRIVWDDTAMRSVYANAANVAGGQEEIVLLFGLNQSWHSGQKDIKVTLSDRVIMNPHAAKRLSVLLSNVLQNYEKQFGKLEM